MLHFAAVILLVISAITIVAVIAANVDDQHGWLAIRRNLMIKYRITQTGAMFGDVHGEAIALSDAIEMAEEFKERAGDGEFIVERVERVWPPLPPRKQGRNRTRTTIHKSDFTRTD